MTIELAGFRALVQKKAGEIKAQGTRDGFHLLVAGDALHTEAGRVRVFKNLTTLARFAKAEGVNTLTIDLTVVPKAPAKTAAKAAPAKKTSSKGKASASV